MVLCMLGLAGCAGAAPTDTPPPTAAATATASTAVEVTADAVSITDDPLELTQTITTQNGQVTLDYPVGWEANEIGPSLILNNGSDDLSGGAIIVNVGVVPAELLPEAETPLDVINTSAVGQGGQLEAGSTFYADAKDAAIRRGSITLEDQTADLLVIVVQDGAVYGTLNVLSAPGTAAEVEPLARAIAASFRYRPA
jgi:hypothetical protein